ncbi:MAG: putative aminopeptidase YsdC [Eubacteriales bacterium SKADARSKE-1]|nr:putative aminopeptidase YsdC [Eubacteriales bacterium SKADARSKE-1]
MKDLIFKLTQPDEKGPDDILSVVSQELSKYAKVTIDKNKNVIGTMGNLNSKQHIMFDAHLDKIGIIVTNICENGFLKVANVGGVDCRVLPGSTVKIYGKKVIFGIVCSTPPHLAKNKDDKFLKVDELLIDPGLSKDEAKKLIEPGIYISFGAEPNLLLNNRIAAPGLDNRAGVCALLHCSKILSKEELNCKVSFVLSSGEEINALGAKTGTFAIEPNRAIVVDTSFGTQPELANENKGVLGDGPMIGISPSISNEISNTLIDLAKSEKIPYQFEVMGGKTGTNADSVAISKSGVKTGLVSIPLRYMHTPCEVVDIDDIKNTAKLLASAVLKGGLYND